MDKRNFIIDAIALVIYLIAATPSITGINLHEYIGLGIFVVLFVHLLLNMDLVIKWTKSAFKHPSFSTTGNYIIDVLLLLSLTLCVISGVLVSGAVLPAMGLFADGYYFWDPVHSFSAKLLLALLLVHIVTHWKWIVSFITKKKEKEQKND